MVLHGWQKRYLDSKPPEEDGRRYLELFAHVSPFLAVVSEKARDQA